MKLGCIFRQKHSRSLLLIMALVAVSIQPAFSKSMQVHSLNPDEDSFSLPIGFSMAAPALRSGMGSSSSSSSSQSSSSVSSGKSSSSSDRTSGPVLHHFKKFQTTPTTYSPSTASLPTSSTTPSIVYAGSYAQQQKYSQQSQYQPQQSQYQTQQSQYKTKQNQYQPQYQTEKSQQSHYQTQQSQQSQYQAQQSQQSRYQTKQQSQQPHYQTEQSQQSQYQSKQQSQQPQYQTEKSQQNQYQTKQQSYQAKQPQQSQYTKKQQQQSQYNLQQSPQQSQYQSSTQKYQSQQSSPYSPTQQYKHTQHQNEIYSGMDDANDDQFLASSSTGSSQHQQYYQKVETKPPSYGDPHSPQDEQSLFQKQQSYQKLHKYQSQNQQSYHNAMSVYNAQQSGLQDVGLPSYQTLQQSYQQKTQPITYHNYDGVSTPVANAVSIEEAVAAAAAVTQRPTTAAYEKYYEAIAATATTPAPRPTSPRYYLTKRKSAHGVHSYPYYKPYQPEHAHAHTHVHAHAHVMPTYTRVIPPPAYRRVTAAATAHRGPAVQHFYHGPYTMEAALPMSSVSDHSSHSWLDHALSPVKRDDSLLSSIGAPAGSSTALLNGLLVPIVLLGLSIPALGFAYTYLNKRRDIGSDFTNYLQDLRPSDETLNEYFRILQTAIECYQDTKKPNC